MDTSNLIEITPEDSVVPIFIEQLTEDQIASIEESKSSQVVVIPEDPVIAQAKASALAKLAKLGLTEEEARAVIGL